MSPEAPVAEYPDGLAVDTVRLALFDDQRTVQGAADLLECALVRVVPICASIRQVEGIGEGLARSDRLLRQVRDAVHGIRQSDAVPVHGCLLVETVFYEHSQPVALAEADLRAGRGAVVTPHLRRSEERSVGQECVSPGRSRW